MDLWFCGLLPWQTGRRCSLLGRWLSVGCGFWGDLDNLGAWQQCNESYPFIAYEGTYQVSSHFLTFVFFPFSDFLPEVCFCVFPIQWFTSRVVCLDQNYSCKVHTNWTLRKLKLYEMTPFSLCIMLMLCLPRSHTSRFTFFLFRIPNVSNCLQPASSKTACVCTCACACVWICHQRICSPNRCRWQICVFWYCVCFYVSCFCLIVKCTCLGLVWERVP